MKNLRSTILGILTILASLGTAGKALLDNEAATQPNFEVTLTGITAGIGLILMREQKQHESDKKNGGT